MSHDPHPAEEYNPERDYKRIMEWIKYAVVACAAITIFLRILIG